MKGKANLAVLVRSACAFWAILVGLGIWMAYCEGKTLGSNVLAALFSVVVFVWPVWFIYLIGRILVMHRDFLAERPSRVLAFAWASSPGVIGLWAWGRVAFQR